MRESQNGSTVRHASQYPLQLIQTNAVLMPDPGERMSLSPGTSKKAFAAGEIALTIHQRESEAKRNKREWWILPTQHRALIDYCQQRQIACTPCPGCVDQREEQQAG